MCGVLLIFRRCILLIALLIKISCLANDLEQYLTSQSVSDDDCIGFVKDESNHPLKPSYLALSMRKGFWKCAKDIVMILQQSGADSRNTFDLESRTIMKEISALKSALESSLPMNSINPSFQWAQSPNEIFINVKFAHKIDAPATLNVDANNVTLLGNYLYLHASDGRKNFILELNLLLPIIPEESSWNMASVGRMVFTLKKFSGPSKWNRLLNNQKKPANMHSWWEIQEKYRDELDKLDEDDSPSPSASTATLNKVKAAVDNAVESVVTASSATTATSTTTASASTDNGTTTDTKKGTGNAEEEDDTEAEKRTALLNVERQRVEKDTKAELKSLDEEVKRRKREVDARSREEKKLLDSEYTSRYEVIQAKRVEALRKIDNPQEELSNTNATTDNSEL